MWERAWDLTWLPPYEGELELLGKDFGDVVIGPCGGLLITERFAEDFKAEGLTGLSGFHPVESCACAGSAEAPSRAHRPAISSSCRPTATRR